MWLLCMGASVVFTVAALILAFQKREQAIWASAASFALTIGSLLFVYKLILHWVDQNDWAALLDVVPTIFLPLCIYAALILLVNALVLFRWKK